MQSEIDPVSQFQNGEKKFRTIKSFCLAVADYINPIWKEIERELLILLFVEFHACATTVFDVNGKFVVIARARDRMCEKTICVFCSELHTSIQFAFLSHLFRSHGSIPER